MPGIGPLIHEIDAKFQKCEKTNRLLLSKAKARVLSVKHQGICHGDNTNQCYAMLSTAFMDVINKIIDHILRLDDSPPSKGHYVF